MKKKLLTLFITLLSFSSFSQERQVKVNGVNYHVYLKGLDERKQGQPAIIFENGLGVGLGHWDTIIDEISKFAPVVAYDRAGVGQSEKIYAEPNIKFVATNLNALLKTLNISSPYILVGHSMGGVYIKGYAGLYPNEIAGLFFIDPADFTETKGDWRMLLRSLGVSEKRAEEMIQERLYRKTPVDSLNFGPWSESQFLTSLRRSDFAELNQLTLPDVPMYFLIGGKFEVPPDKWSKEYYQRQFFDLRTGLNIQHWRKFIYSSSKGGLLIYVSKAGHFVHSDDPEIVIRHVRMMLESLAD